MVSELVVAELFQSFLGETSALHPFQSDFRPGLGTWAVLEALVDHLNSHMDEGKALLLVLFDLSCAFHTDNMLLIQDTEIHEGRGLEDGPMLVNNMFLDSMQRAY